VESTNQKKQLGICMVVGCERTAIYRSPFSTRKGNTLRGYCSRHRELAMTKAGALDDKRNEGYLLRGIKE
jgi:hypothetical protein